MLEAIIAYFKGSAES